MPSISFPPAAAASAQRGPSGICPASVSWARRACLLLSVVGSAAMLAACGTSKPAPAVTVTKTQSAQPSASSSASAGAAVAPAIVAVTTAGALVTVNPATGAVAQTLVPGHVLGDEISVSSTGMVYFAVSHGCMSEIEGVPVAGGSASVIVGTNASLPAVSPDGTKLAYVDQPSLTIGCIPSNPDLVPLYHLYVRTLSTGANQVYPMVPKGQDTGLPAPISHLSWASDNDHLAVSIASIQDNEGWNLVLVDTAQAKYYLTGVGTTDVPVTGQPSPQRSYLREGVYMPNGHLFVSRACCGGIPVRNTSRLMWEVGTDGVLVHQVAIGYSNLDHVSLDVSPDGQWLLYLAGHDLYVSHGGATPSKLTSGLIAAAWG